MGQGGYAVRASLTKKPTDSICLLQGTGFVTVHLPEPLGAVTIAICMDLNAQPGAEWTLSDGPYELASYCVSNNTKVLVLLNAWLDSCVEKDEKKDWYTLNYWTSRLRPLWVRPPGKEPDDNSQGNAEDTGHQTIVVVCNRCGEENGADTCIVLYFCSNLVLTGLKGVRFAGTSALFSMRRESGRPALLQAMGRREEGVKIWTV